MGKAKAKVRDGHPPKAKPIDERAWITEAAKERLRDMIGNNATPSFADSIASAILNPESASLETRKKANELLARVAEKLREEQPSSSSSALR